MKYDQFRTDIINAVKKFSLIKKSEKIRLISHYDADGLCSASQLISALNRNNRSYSLTIVPQLTEKEVIKLSSEKYKAYIFSDLGSGQIKYILKYLKNRKIFILDHHFIEKINQNKAVHINPHLYDIDGSEEISGSGVVYLFCKALNPKNRELCHLPIIGAIGDAQENSGFSGFNNEFLKEAVLLNKIKIKTSINWFGIETKPLFKLLAYDKDIFIPGVSGSESCAIQFLNQIQIKPKIKGDWVKYNQLDEKQKQRLITAIVMKRTNQKNPEDILGKRYILVEEQKNLPTRDAKEFSTLLNACGRMDAASLGIGACLNRDDLKQKAIKCMDQYRREIGNALRWYEENKDTKKIIKGKNYIILNTGNDIRYTIIGTLASIISNSNNFKQETYIISMGYTPDNIIKISIRKTGNIINSDLREILKEIVINIDDSEIGGHKNAAGGYVLKDKESEFIESVKKNLS
ncbi:hypothetical protein GF327_08695 [Candidatus Woesearchaeota archaeon]|nr:hypothetical protein [Candidatus Woesearchaeota archaeon]